MKLMDVGDIYSINQSGVFKDTAHKSNQMKIKLKDVDRGTMIEELTKFHSDRSSSSPNKMRIHYGKYTDTMIFGLYVQMREQQCKIKKAFEHMKGGHIDIRRYFQICIADALEELSVTELQVVYEKTFEEVLEPNHPKVREIGITRAINRILMEACDYDHLYRSS